MKKLFTVLLVSIISSCKELGVMITFTSKVTNIVSEFITTFI